MNIVNQTIKAFLLTIVILASSTGIAADAACSVSEQVFIGHIKPRHCDTNIFVNKDKFIPAFCIGVAAANNFCAMVQNNVNVTRTVQVDGRIRYDADLGLKVGTEDQECGRVIITGETNGTVITQFPEHNC